MRVFFTAFIKFVLFLEDSNHNKNYDVRFNNDSF